MRQVQKAQQAWQLPRTALRPVHRPVAGPMFETRFRTGCALKKGVHPKTHVHDFETNGALGFFGPGVAVPVAFGVVAHTAGGEEVERAGVAAPSKHPCDQHVRVMLRPSGKDSQD